MSQRSIDPRRSPTLRARFWLRSAESTDGYACPYLASSCSSPALTSVPDSDRMATDTATSKRGIMARREKRREERRGEWQKQKRRQNPKSVWKCESRAGVQLELRLPCSLLSSAVSSGTDALTQSASQPVSGVAVQSLLHARFSGRRVHELSVTVSHSRSIPSAKPRVQSLRWPTYIALRAHAARRHRYTAGRCRWRWSAA